MATKRLDNRPIKELSSEQKVAFALLMFLGFGGLFFGFKSFGANMTRPIQQQIADLYTGEEYLTSTDREARELEESKTKDTDSDGLVDYDELYIYKTSPYLADSDSDGFDDMTEVYSGNDPNCPQNKDCGVIVSAEETNTSNSAVEGLLKGLGEDDLLEAGVVQFESAQDIEEFFKQATIDEIRNALLEAGMTQEELEIIDDATLEAYFYGAIDDAAESGAFDELIDE